jgi:translation initiation factor IF-2
MAKVRVYELARELNLDSKKLVEELLAGGMDIGNYMSTLDEQAAMRAREIVSGGVTEVVEEKRVKPTIIRRRKKRIEVEERVLEAKAAETPVSETGEEPVPEGPPEIEAVLAAKTPETPTAVPEQPLESDIEEDSVQAQVKGEIDTAEIEEQAIVTPSTVEPETGEVAEPEPETKAKSRKIRKKRRDQPAKIILRPEEGPLKDMIQEKERSKEPEPVAAMEVPVAVPGKIAEEISDKSRKAKPAKKKKRKEKEKTQEFDAKIAPRYRKKEVFERVDLYGGKGPKRKEKKGQKKGRDVERRLKSTEITVPKAIKRRLKVQQVVTVGELAKAMGTKGVDLIRSLMKLGVVTNINQSIDFETAALVADEFGYELELDSFEFEEERLTAEIEDRKEDLVSRPPVVTIMGHVDHGKTSLLDYIRKSNIIGGESGGITQHIGAYYVQTDKGDIVFLDTPGHEAFTAMRARGAKVTDLIVLVVAADDGVMPQTKEAVNHARAAGIPIVVAINKMDKPDADPDRVRRELAELDLSPEEWGGETIFGQISAKTGQGVDELLSLILLQSEMLELKGNPEKPARGTIIEARLDKSRGPIATVLIKTGTLVQGNYFICGQHYGRVRAMMNHRGKKLQSAGPSFPVEIYGISGVPMAGDEFIVVPDEKTAKQVTELRIGEKRKLEVGKTGIVTLDQLFDKIKEGEIKELNIVLKADVQGSLEALSGSLEKLSTENVKLNIIHAATGAIAESDVMLASASGAVVIGFNVRTNPRVAAIAEKENVDIRYYDVIYNALQDIRAAMVGLLEPVYEEDVIGRASVKEIFHLPKVGTIAGCQVTDGHAERNAKVRLLRDDVVIFSGKLASLKRFKDDVKEVQSGYECGIGLENFQDIKPADVLEFFNMKEIEAQL